jgi:ABC-2 type transport system permease protein
MTTIAARPTTAMDHRVTFVGVLRSEWRKFRTLRSPVWILALSVLTVMGLGLLMAFAFTALQGIEGAEVQVAFSEDAANPLAPDNWIGLGPAVATLGIYLAQIAIITLGVLTITGEYSSGMIRSTLVAAPKRLPVLWAKAIVVAVFAFVVGTVSSFATYLVTHPILAGAELESSLANPEVARMLLGGGLYLMGVALLSLALGAIIRNAAGGIGATIGLLVLLPNVLALIPVEWIADASVYLPSTAGQRIFEASSEAAILSPWEGFGVLLVWAALGLAAAAVQLRRRDA